MSDFIYNSFLKDVIGKIDKSKNNQLKEAAVHIRKKMRDKLNSKSLSRAGGEPGKNSGRLRKGVRIKIDPSADKAFVGMAPPAYHAHLLEFGTMNRKRKNGGFSGKVDKRPFFVKTFEEESDAVMKILREPWVK